ncbi:MAG: glycosyltransferase family 4 protein [Treponema sp.]|nr:glycosyltransferase family 4 protein [Treponema sp.]
MNKVIDNIFGRIYHPIVKYFRTKPELSRVLFKKCFSRTEERKNRIYIDVTQVFIKDVGTGVQRVTNNIVKYIADYSNDYDIEKVYLDNKKGVFSCESKKPVTFIKGDIFFELDLNYILFTRYKHYFKRLRNSGVKISIFIHDLIPIRYPEFFDVGTYRVQYNWMKVCLRFNQIIANSKSTLDDVKAFIKESNYIKRNRKIQLDYALLGCDFSAMPKLDAQEAKNDKLSFLMVSTVDKRKNYKQALEAFSILWDKGLDVRLDIVGRPGWCCEDTIEMIRAHSELNKRLFWHSTGISDEELAKLYSTTSAVIFASLAEGFGLAITEGAYFKKPLILRDLPVFKEIAGENAYYFSGTEAEKLADALEKWIDLYKNGKVPDSSKIKLRTWNECTKEVYEYLVR